MADFTYTLISEQDRLPSIGLLALQADETIESELRQWIAPGQADLYVSRVPSGLEVTPDSLREMEGEITAAASLFPRTITLDVVAYGCTSASAILGPDRVAELARQGCACRHVTEPVSALVWTCRSRNIRRLAFLSPYIESVSTPLRDVLGKEGIETPVFGSFNEAEEARVARIDPSSIATAASALAELGGVDAIFISCTNLKALNILPQIEAATGLPAFSSNSVLAEHVRELAGLADRNYKRFFTKARPDPDFRYFSNA